MWLLAVFVSCQRYFGCFANDVFEEVLLAPSSVYVYILIVLAYEVW